MQCKNIPEQPVLEFLLNLPYQDHLGQPTEWQRAGTWFWNDCFQPENSVVRAMPAGTPPKLARAKMAGLIRRGLVGGCACGCRGDFEITGKGRLFLHRASADRASPARHA